MYLTGPGLVLQTAEIFSILDNISYFMCIYLLICYHGYDI